MLPTQTDKLTPQEISEAVDAINGWMGKRGLTIRDLHRKLGEGFSRGTLSQVLNGKYKGNQANKLRQILRLMDTDDEAAKIARPAGLVETFAVKRMMTLIQRTHAARTIGVIVAPAGCSKTTVFEAAHVMITGSIFVRVLATSTSAAGFIHAIGTQLRINRRYHSCRCLEKILEKLKDSGRLILVDEAHRLRPTAFEVVRDLVDCGVAVVLAGTADLNLAINDQLAGAQLYSRVAMSLDLSDYMAPARGGKPRQIHSVEEVIAICKGDRLRFTGDARDLLCRIANAPGLGALRTCQLLVSVVAMARDARTKPITADRLWNALRSLKGETARALAEHEIEKIPPALSRTA